MSSPLVQNKHWATQVVREALSAGSNTELLKALVEVFPGSWFFTRLDGSFAFVNQRACDELGYAREDLMALSLFDINPGMTREIWNSLNDVGPFTPASVRTVHRRKDGSVFPVEAFGSRIILGEENVAVSYVVDLSEEKQAQEALAEKKLLLTSLLEQAPVLVWLVDPHGHIERFEGSLPYCNRFNDSKSIGKTMDVLFSEVPELQQATARALSGELVDGIVSLGNVDIEYRYVPRRNDAGLVIGATGVALDVTKRHAIEQANRRLTTAIDQSEESVVLLDANGIIEYANPAFVAISGTLESPISGLPWISLIPKSSEPGDAAGQLERAITDGNSWRGTLHGLRRHGNDCIEQVTLSPLRDAQGKATGFVAVARDITEQVRTHERLRQVEKMDAIGQLAGGVAHDFNNLLQIILGNVSLCMAKMPPESIRSMLAEVEQAGQRATSLVAQLLAFNRKSTAKHTAIELGDLVNRLLPLIRRMVGEHIRVDVEQSSYALTLTGDESQLEQVIMNLCVNARDAMPEGGRLLLALGREELGTEAALSLGLSSGGNYVFIEAIDTGCGMTEELQRRIFEPFFTTKGVGSGIGLATVYAVTKRHGGTIDVRSEVGKGSRFRVLLSCSNEVASTRGASAVPPCRTRKGRLLLVEDDSSVRQVTRAFLEQAGHTVLVAHDGVDAISIIEREKAVFDLIVLDAIMPNASGPEVYRRFRKLSSNPVLFVTGHSFNAFDTLPEDPARALLAKPYTATALAALVQQLLQSPNSVAEHQRCGSSTLDTVT